MTPSQNRQQIDFPKLMEQILSLLTEKEQNVISRRFSLGGIPRETLDKIGKSYSITRERVRQIEMMAIKKLARISMDPSMRFIHELAHIVLSEHGGVMSEELLVSEMLKRINEEKHADVNAMKLAMRISNKLIKQEKNQFHHAFWRVSGITLPGVRGLIKSVQKVLQKKGNVMSVEDVERTLREKASPGMVASVLHIDKGFCEAEGKWGLASWRHINPRSIKDKILIILKSMGKPLHFSDIARHVLNDFSAKKRVTPQAIHNELIRHDEFILVGRGLYGLKEWGMVAGTVCDVIKTVLIENKGPMKRQEIIEAVLKKRDIRIGTISLNLQKYAFFKRVGRAVYEYDKALDPGKKRRKKRK